MVLLPKLATSCSKFQWKSPGNERRQVLIHQILSRFLKPFIYICPVLYCEIYCLLTYPLTALLLRNAKARHQEPKSIMVPVAPLSSFPTKDCLTSPKNPKTFCAGVYLLRSCYLGAKHNASLTQQRCVTTTQTERLRGRSTWSPPRLVGRN